MTANATLADFHFLRPLALLLVLAAPLFWLLWRNVRSEAGAWRAAVDAHLLPYLLERVAVGRGRAGLALASVFWLIACFALAGPAWEREPMPLYRNQAARVLALELSQTMLAQDEKPNRLSRARYKIADILAHSRDYQTALIGYAGDAFVAAPLTDDIGTVGNLVDALDPATMPVAGNDTARAIDAGVALIEQAGLHHGEIILLADSVSGNAEAAARRAQSRGISISVLGLGNGAGAPVPLAQGDFLKDDSGNVVISRIDESALRAVAQAGGGRYAHFAADASDLDTLLADRVDAAARSDEAGAAGDATRFAESVRWRDRGPWLLLLLLPLALTGFRRGWLMALPFALMLPTAPVHAAALTDLWQRPDQQAAAAIARGDAKDAAGIATTPDWHASAAYRAGDFAAAADGYANVQGADGAYNRGNALTKLGRYDEALAAYDEALRQAPDMADAKANRQAVEEFLKKQQQDPNSQGNKNGKDGKPKNGKNENGAEQKGEPRDGEKKDGEQQNESGDQQNRQGQQGQSQDPPQSGEQSDRKQHDTSQSDSSPQDSGKSATGAGDEKEGKADAKDAQAPDAAQQQALSKEIDKALAGRPQAGDPTGKQRAGVAEEDDATREKRQALDHWLQRVPDDPGGLLRRKFQLEYQRRQQQGGDDR